MSFSTQTPNDEHNPELPKKETNLSESISIDNLISGTLNALKNMAMHVESKSGKSSRVHSRSTTPLPHQITRRADKMTIEEIFTTEEPSSEENVKQMHHTSGLIPFRKLNFSTTVEKDGSGSGFMSSMVELRTYFPEQTSLVDLTVEDDKEEEKKHQVRIIELPVTKQFKKTVQLVEPTAEVVVDVKPTIQEQPQRKQQQEQQIVQIQKIDLQYLAKTDIEASEQAFQGWRKSKEQARRSSIQLQKEMEKITAEAERADREERKRKSEQAFQTWLRKHPNASSSQHDPDTDDECVVKKTQADLAWERLHEGEANTDARQYLIDRKYQEWLRSKQQEEKLKEEEQEKRARIEEKLAKEKRKAAKRAFKKWAKEKKKIEKQEQEQRDKAWEEAYNNANSDTNVRKKAMKRQQAWVGVLDKVESETSRIDKLMQQGWKGSKQSFSSLQRLNQQQEETLQSPPLLFTEYERYQEQVPDYVKKYPSLVARAGDDMRVWTLNQLRAQREKEMLEQKKYANVTSKIGSRRGSIKSTKSS